MSWRMIAFPPVYSLIALGHRIISAPATASSAPGDNGACDSLPISMPNVYVSVLKINPVPIVVSRLAYTILLPAGIEEPLEK